MSKHPMLALEQVKQQLLHMNSSHMVRLMRKAYLTSARKAFGEGERCLAHKCVFLARAAGQRLSQLKGKEWE